MLNEHCMIIKYLPIYFIKINYLKKLKTIFFILGPRYSPFAKTTKRCRTNIGNSLIPSETETCFHSEVQKETSTI